MADSKVTGLPALTAVAVGDLFYVVDISDVTDDAAGSSKQITRANLITAVANTFTLGQTIAQDAATGSPISALTVTGAAHTALTASTENIGVNLNMSATKQFATGALTTQREVVIQGPTYGFVGASTITDAVTLHVKEPTAGTNATITRKAAIVSEGTVVIRQPGGVVGTDEGQLYHDGTDLFIKEQSGVGAVNFFSRGATRFSLTDTLLLDANIADLAAGGNDLLLNKGGTYLLVQPAFTLSWRASSGGSVDVSLARTVAGVLKIGNAIDGTGSGWLQQTAAVAILSANFTSTNVTMANTNLSRTVIAGRSYGFRLLLPVNNATAGDGFKCNFAGGTVTATTFYAFAFSRGTVTEGNVASAAMATDLTFTVATSTCAIVIEGTLVVNAAGTIILRAAKNSDAAGATMTLLAGARFELYDLLPV